VRRDCSVVSALRPYAVDHVSRDGRPERSGLAFAPDTGSYVVRKAEDEFKALATINAKSDRLSKVRDARVL